MQRPDSARELIESGAHTPTWSPSIRTAAHKPLSSGLVSTETTSSQRTSMRARRCAISGRTDVSH